MTSRDELITHLSELTLPLMWTLRQDAMRAFEALGVRPVKALLLAFIARGMQHPKDLAEVLDTVPPTVSAMLAELEDAGHVTRQIDPSDRRRVCLTLTPQGEALSAQLKDAWLAAGRERARVLSTDELGALVTTYRKLVNLS